MTRLLVLPALYLLVDVLGLSWCWWMRRGAPRSGPFTAPGGVEFWAIHHDPLAQRLGTQKHCTTINRTVGFSAAEITITPGLLAHEVGVHIAAQWRVAGWLSAALMFPLFVVCEWWGKTSPLERPAYREQARIMALPTSDPERRAWQQLADTLNGA